MKETKSQYLTRLFHYWCGRCKVKKPITVVEDKRIKLPMLIDNWDDEEKICMRYNPNIIKNEKKFVIINYIFHEIGHLIHKLPYNTYKQKVKAEREAEKFALAMMKKYYPKQYKLFVKYVKEVKTLEFFKKTDKLYYDAFKYIKEYKEV